jgi:hypothetical protein
MWSQDCFLSHLFIIAEHTSLILSSWFADINCLCNIDITILTGTPIQYGGMKSAGNDRKYALSFPIIFLLLGNDMETIRSKMILITKNWYIRNETIGSKICRYRSITAPQIENTETMNGHISNVFTTKWVTNSPTWILLHHMPIL